jgi:hypothetical protein
MPASESATMESGIDVVEVDDGVEVAVVADEGTSDTVTDGTDVEVVDSGSVAGDVA